MPTRSAPGVFTEKILVTPQRMPPTTEQNSVILKKLLNILFTGRRNNGLVYSLYNLDSTELKTHHPFGGFFLNQFTQQLKRISEAGEMAFI